MEDQNRKFLWVIAIVNVITLILLTVFFVMSWDLISKKSPVGAIGQQGGMTQQQNGGGMRPPTGGGTAGGNADTMKVCVDSCVQGGKTFPVCISECEAQ